MELPAKVHLKQAGRTQEEKRTRNMAEIFKYFFISIKFRAFSNLVNSSPRTEQILSQLTSEKFIIFDEIFKAFICALKLVDIVPEKYFS